MLKGRWFVCARGWAVCARRECACSRGGGVCVHEVGWCVQEGSVRAGGCMVGMLVSVRGEGCVWEDNEIVCRSIAKLKLLT